MIDTPDAQVAAAREQSVFRDVNERAERVERVGDENERYVVVTKIGAGEAVAASLERRRRSARDEQ